MKGKTFVVGLLLLLFLTACGGPGELPEIQSPPLQPPAAEDPAPSAPEIEEPLPEELPDLEGAPEPDAFRSVLDSCQHADFVLRADGVLLSRGKAFPDDPRLLGRQGAYDEFLPVLENIRLLHVPRSEYGTVDTVYAIDNDNKLWSWSGTGLPKTELENIIQVGANEQIAYALDTDGRVWARGSLSNNGFWRMDQFTPLLEGVSALQLGAGGDGSVWMEYPDGQVTIVSMDNEGKVQEEALPWQVESHFERVILTADGKVYDLSADPQQCLAENVLHIGGGRGEYGAVTAEGKQISWKTPLDRPEDNAIELLTVAENCRYLQRTWDGNFWYLDQARTVQMTEIWNGTQTTGLDHVLAQAGELYIRTDCRLWEMRRNEAGETVPVRLEIEVKLP